MYQDAARMTLKIPQLRSPSSLSLFLSLSPSLPPSILSSSLRLLSPSSSASSSSSPLIPEATERTGANSVKLGLPATPMARTLYVVIGRKAKPMLNGLQQLSLSLSLSQGQLQRAQRGWMHWPDSRIKVFVLPPLCNNSQRLSIEQETRWENLTQVQVLASHASFRAFHT